MRSLSDRFFLWVRSSRYFIRIKSFPGTYSTKDDMSYSWLFKKINFEITYSALFGGKKMVIDSFDKYKDNELFKNRI